MDEATLATAAFAASLVDFQAAATRVATDAIVTPVLPLKCPDKQLWLKAECLQPLGSFKIRAGANAIAMADADQLAGGVVTASAGNFAQGVALAAVTRGLPVHVFAPDTASGAKITALERIGATVEIVSFEAWWHIIQTRETSRDGFFIHPVSELSVILGNGGIGLEIATQVPDVDVVVVPVGGGGLISGISLALKALGKTPRIVAAEIESSTPLAAAKAAGMPKTVVRGKTWIDGIGSTRVLEEMWPILDQMVDDVVVVSHVQAAAALRHLAAEAHVIVEGAAAVAAAAALSSTLAGKKVVAVLSGGNIEAETYARILTGQDE